MNELNIDRLMQALSEILSDKYGVQIIVRATPKDQSEVEDADTH